MSITTNNSSQPSLFEAKMFIIGEYCVGKTSIIHRYWDNGFQENTKDLGFDQRNKKKEIQGRMIRLNVWDTAGLETGKTVSKGNYRGCLGLIFCYAINSRESFEELDYWMKQANEDGARDACKILVATKNDLPAEERVVEKAEGEAKARAWGVKFFEISSKLNIGVNEAIEYLAGEIKTQKADLQQNNNESNSMNSSVKLRSTLNSNDRKKKENKCC